MTNDESNSKSEIRNSKDAAGPQVLSADAVVPMDGGLLIRDGHGGGVAVVDGRVVKVGTVGELRREYGDWPWEHVAGVMMPGLVNAHVHLELTGMRGMLPAGHFVDWVKELLRYQLKQTDAEGAAAAGVRAGVAESLRYGVTCVGDIAKHVGAARGILREGAMRAVSFGEITGIGARRGMLGERIALCSEGAASELMGIGVSPHAPYTVEGPALEAILKRATAGGLPVAMHLAELLEEGEFLRSLGGRLREPWDLGGTAHLLLDERIPRFEGGPIRWAERYGLFEAARGGRVPVVLAHVNYCDDEEMGVLAQSGASVCYCPRTREFFGHEQVQPHRYREMLEAGVNVCLGTDSLASNPDLSVLAEAAMVHRRDGISATAAMEMVTWRGAKALGVEAGRLAEGRWADVIVMPVEMATGDSADRVLGRVLSHLPEPHGLWVSGRRVR